VKNSENQRGNESGNRYLASGVELGGGEAAKRRVKA
jgi:hypothetical protein